MKREPGTPALVALTFALTDGGRDVRACAASSPEWCKTLRTRERMLLLLPFLALVLLVYLAGYDITANATLAASAALCAALGTGLIEGSMAFLTEPPAAVLLLLVAWMLYRVVRVNVSDGFGSRRRDSAWAACADQGGLFLFRAGPRLARVGFASRFVHGAALQPARW